MTFVNLTTQTSRKIFHEIEKKRNLWRYSFLWHEYKKKYSDKHFIKDFSFIITEGKNILCFCPIFLEDVNGVFQLSYAGGFQSAPLIFENKEEAYKKKIERICFQKIDEIAKKNKALKAMIIADVPFEWKFNHFQQFGFNEYSIQTSIINLKDDEAKLWSNLRSRYKQYINKAKREFEIIVVDAKKPSFKLHEIYRHLHFLASGKHTRSKETFNLQFEMLKSDNAIFIGLQKKSKIYAISYFLHDEEFAYFASAADDPNLKTNIPLEHLIMWEAILYYKKRGLKYFETGWQQFGTQFFDFPSQKDKDISFFKRGFGGEIVSLYRGIKYYDKNFEKREKIMNIKKYFENEN